MNIEDMIMNGATPEEVSAELQKVYMEKQRQEAALRAKETAPVNKSKEELKREGRAYAINALLAYIEAFDLLPEGVDYDEEDIAQLEVMLIKLEDMIPLYVKLAELQKDMDKTLGLDDIDPSTYFKGLF